MRTQYIHACLILATLTSSLVLVAGAADVDQPAPLTQVTADNALISADSGDNSTVIWFAARPGGVGGSTAEAEAEASVSAFVGDYADDVVAAVVFEIQSEEGIAPKSFRVQLFEEGEDIHSWNSEQAITTPAGEWDRKTVGFNRTADGWRRALAVGVDPDDAFNAALANVARIGIRLVPEGTAEQTYRIRNFMLVTKLGKVLFGPYGVSSVAQVGDQGAGDQDQDGMTDLEEDLVGTDKTLASSIFTAEVLGATDDGVTVKWASAQEYATYAVYRTDNLVAGFGAAPVAELTYGQLAHPAAGSSLWLDTTMADPSAGPYYYKVVCVIP